MSPETKVWFITGCSSGLGRCMTEHALKKGDKVVATLRKPEVLSDLAIKHPETLLVLRLDVTIPAEVATAFATSHERFGRVDVVVNNAGYGVTAEVEGTPDSVARDMFEVNLWGASNVTREAVRFFREVNKPMGGRLLQVTSMSGIQSSPGAVYYCASKFALEAISEGIAEELHPDWNIKVTMLEPGPFRTRGTAADTTVILPVHPAYTDPSLPTMKWRGIIGSTNLPIYGEPDKFAEMVYKAAYLKDPPLRLPIHPMSLAMLKKKGKQLLETADVWESWSEDIITKE